MLKKILFWRNSLPYCQRVQWFVNCYSTLIISSGRKVVHDWQQSRRFNRHFWGSTDQNYWSRRVLLRKNFSYSAGREIREIMSFFLTFCFPIITQIMFAHYRMYVKFDSKEIGSVVFAERKITQEMIRSCQKFLSNLQFPSTQQGIKFLSNQNLEKNRVFNQNHNIAPGLKSREFLILHSMDYYGVPLVHSGTNEVKAQIYSEFWNVFNSNFLVLKFQIC